MSHGKTFVGINCGANVNFDRLRHIAERSAVGKKSEVLLAVEINEEPGSFKNSANQLEKEILLNSTIDIVTKPLLEFLLALVLTAGLMIKNI